MAAIAVVLPTYNEAENLEPLVSRLLALGPDYRVIVVDDDSPDGTGRIAQALASRHSGRVDVLHRTLKSRAKAGLDGLRHAVDLGVDLVVEMDADFSHDPGQVPALVAACRDVDVAIGSRYVPGGRVQGRALIRYLTSRFANLYAGIALGPTVRDWCGGFKCYRSSVLASLDLSKFRSKEHAIGMELLFRLRARGATFREVPITFVERARGRTKFAPFHVAEYILMPALLWWDHLSMARPRLGKLVAWSATYGTFIVGGAIGAAVNWAITASLSQIAGLWYLLAFSVGILCNVTFNYFYNNRITFSMRRANLRSGTRFLVLSTGAVACLLGLTYFLTEVAGLFYLYSIVIATIVLSVVSFEVSRGWAFVP